MSDTRSSDRLYELLPALYRIRDAEHGEPLRALLGILEEQLHLLERDVEGLYDDWFIETCEEWVIPYIADLLGVRLLHDVESAGVFSQRALVANTLSFRRRKGTLAMIEDLAGDVTGWPSRAVAFFELLGWTQNLDHLRYDLAPNADPDDPDEPPFDPPAVDRVGTVHLRNLDVVDRIDGPFDVVAHNVDVRPLGQSDGWHNIRNVGLFIWRLGSYPILRSTPRRSATDADGFHFSPLGNPAPLFTNPARKDDKGLAGETNVPGPIRPVAFFRNLETYYGEEADKSLAVYRRETAADPFELVPVDEVMCKDLSLWSSPPAGKVAVDVKLGRLAFASGEAPVDGNLLVTYHYGFSADLGGGPYDRRASLETTDTKWEVTVSKTPPDPKPPNWEKTIDDAITSWKLTEHSRAVITIADNRTYAEENVTVSLGGKQHLTLQADDRNRPTVRLLDGDGKPSVMTVKGEDGEDASLTLNGLLIEGGIRVDAQNLGRIEILHSTLVPGRALDEKGRPKEPAAASLEVAHDVNDLEILIDRSITGALQLPAGLKALTVRDSILDRPEDEARAPRVALAADDAGKEPGPPTTLERVTVFGQVRVETLVLASEVIFTRRVISRRRQQGCVRYSFVDDRMSITPRRFRCQPDLALAARREEFGVKELAVDRASRIRSRLRPDFTSEHYGQPAYAQLSRATAEEIRTGAEAGSEMGVYEHLKQPQREANLRLRLDEYLPYGLEAGWIYVT